MPPSALRRLSNANGLVRIGGKGLLAKYVLPGLERQQGPLRVQGVGQGHIDRIDILIVKQLLVGAVYHGDSVPAGKLGSPVAIARGDRITGDAGRMTGGFDQSGKGNIGRAEAADPELCHCGSSNHCDGRCLTA
jgi:hypothetical protein